MKNNFYSKLIICQLKIDINEPYYSIKAKVLNAFKDLNKNEFPFGRKKMPENINELETFLKNYYQRKFRELGDDSVYLVNYIEKEGSFIIEFSFLIISSLSTYATCRQTIDIFLDDISNILSSIFDSSDVTHKILMEKEISSKKNLNMNNYSKYSSSISLLSILISIVLTLYIIIFKPIESISKTDQEIEKKIKEAINQQKLDYLFYNQYFKDTIIKKEKATHINTTSANP